MLPWKINKRLQFVLVMLMILTFPAVLIGILMEEELRIQNPDRKQNKYFFIFWIILDLIRYLIINS